MKKSEQNTIQATMATFSKNTRFYFEDFLITCPFSLEYLKKPNRMQEIREWRQIGLAWYAMEYNSLTKSGKVLNRNHATVLHALKRIQDRKFDPSLEEKVKQILDCMDLAIESPIESGLKEVNSLVYLENLIRKKLQLVEK
jgi:hypothetical protein